MTFSPHSGSGVSRESAARAAVVAGLVDTLITLAALIAARSSVILADFFKTGLEFIAVLLAWLAIRRIQRGADHRFQYGVGKLENLSSLFVGVIMLFSILIIMVNAIRNIRDPHPVAGLGVWISVISQIAYMLINGFLCWRARRSALEDPSPIMSSQIRLFMSKAFANLFILLSLGLSLALQGHFAWAHYIDSISSIIIALFILLAATGIFSSSFYDLLDKTLDEELQIVILRELARHFDSYEALHGVRSRRSGSHVFIEIFLEFHMDKKMSEVQPVIDELRRSIESQIQGSRVTVGLTTEAIA
jgi:ferrous-iron efflux pump FieF